MVGSFVYSLVATDVCTGWTEAVPLLAREQSLVVAGLEAIANQLPFPIRGIDSDNDSVFIVNADGDMTHDRRSGVDPSGFCSAIRSVPVVVSGLLRLRAELLLRRE